jgi:hypothetical protein
LTEAARNAAADVTIQFTRPEAEHTAYGPVDVQQQLPTVANPEGGQRTFSTSAQGVTLNTSTGAFTATNLGPHTFQVDYVWEGQSAPTAQSGTYMIFRGDLDIENVSENDEESLGGFVAKGGARKKINLKVDNPGQLSGGKMTLTVVSGGDKIEIWTAATGGNKLWPNNWRPPNPNPLQFDVGTQDLYVQPVAASAAIRDVTLKLAFGITEEGEWKEWDETDAVRLTVVSADLASVVFTSDHDVLRTWNTNFANAGTPQGLFVPTGWQKSPLINNPVSHTKGGNVSCSVTVQVKPGGLQFNLSGDSQVAALDLGASGVTSTGGNQAVSVAGATPLQSAVGVVQGGDILDPDRDCP